MIILIQNCLKRYYRFCAQSLDELNIQKGNKENKKLLFASILDKNCINNINECYIPGN